MTETQAQPPSHGPVTAADVMEPALSTIEPEDHAAAAA